VERFHGVERIHDVEHIHAMKREVTRELLDELPASDLRAIQSRRDLQKVNIAMGHARIMTRALAGAFGDSAPRSIVDLGGGDGTQLLRLAKIMAPRWKPMRAVIVDRQGLLSAQTKAEFEALSWRVESVETDIFAWLERSHAESMDVTVTSLFLHHFKEADLRRLLQHAAAQTGLFLACEPRRANFPLLGASLLGFIGCNDVTRHDAKVSVRAGFAENELSTLWPVGDGWQLRETHAGLFSHCFVAQRANEKSS
jgi:SAM-dependent methyltransferase